MGIKMKNKIVIQHNKALLFQGCILAALGVLGPVLISERGMGIYNTLHTGMLDDNSTLLLWAALKLVAMNTLRAVPHYLGAFLINESVYVCLKGKKQFLINVVFTFFLIFFIYDIIYRIYGIRYDLGIPALLIIAFVLLLSYMDLFSVTILNKVVLVASLLTSVQWLDVIPLLSQYGFGGGEISMDVKIAAGIMREDKLLTLFACCMFSAFLYASVIQVELLIKEHRLRISDEKARQMEKDLYNTQIEALRLRNSSEVQNLVHDLKSPLTTIQGLISLAEMMEQNGLIREYFQKISSSLTAMSMMISEILYENTRTLVKTSELMHTVLAQVSIVVPNERLIYENLCPDERILGNKIRLSRAVVNLITNAYHAVDKEKGTVFLNVAERGEHICITILDNGSGISRESMGHVWDIGYSGRQSTGLGLAFARQVVENHGGTIELESEEGKFTKVVIRLRKEWDTGGEREDNLGN